MRSRSLRAGVWALAVLVSLAGAWISANLTARHARLVLGMPSEQGWLDRACTATEKANCEKVMESHWGQIRLGRKADAPAIATAELGLFYFTFVLCWLVLIGTPSPSRWWVQLALACVTAAGLGSSVFLAYQMYARLEYWCPLCAATHAATLLLVICVLLLWPRGGTDARPQAAMGAMPQALADDTPVATGGAAPEPETPMVSDSLFGPAGPPPRRQAPRWLVGLARLAGEPDAGAAVGRRPWPDRRAMLLTPLIGLLAIYGEHTHFGLMSAQAKYENANTAANKLKVYWLMYDNEPIHPFLLWAMSPKITLPVGPDDPVRGPADAKNTLVVWSDFQCPVCHEFEKMLQDKIIPMSRSTGGLKVIFKHWPLSPACNRHAPRNTHPYACEAALAAEAARLLGGPEAFWKMHDLLFACQEELPRRRYGPWAQEIGLDPDRFLALMRSPQVLARVQQDIEQGELVGSGQVSEQKQKPLKVSGTPAIFFNGKRVVSWRLETMWAYMLQGYTLQFRPPAPTATQPATQTAPP